jgi:hypothetical protein
MPTLLEIASRVEASMEAYKSVQDFTERDVWKERFSQEKVSFHFRGVFTVLITPCI